MWDAGHSRMANCKRKQFIGRGRSRSTADNGAAAISRGLRLIYESNKRRVVLSTCLRGPRNWA